MTTREGGERRKGNNMTLKANTEVSLSCAEICASAPADPLSGYLRETVISLGKHTRVKPSKKLLEGHKRAEVAGC